MNNSLQVGSPVIGNDFIGRKKEIELIIQLLYHGQSVVLIAPRRFGKTSVMLEVLRLIKKSNLFSAYIDIFLTPTISKLAEEITEKTLANKKLDKAFGKLKKNIRGMFKNIKLKQVINEYEFILEFANINRDEIKLLEDSIDFIEDFSKNNKKKIIVGFDEFGDMSKLNGGELIKLFRSKLQLQKNATYLFSGSYESVMSAIFITSKSPFYRFARIINLGYIQEDVFAKHIIMKLKKQDQQITEVALNALLSFTKGHPYYTQLILQQLLLSNNFREINEKHIKEVIDSLLYIEVNFLEKNWEDLSKSYQNVVVLLALAKQEGPIYSQISSKKINIYRTLQNLMNNGTLSKKSGSYFFNDPLFAYWIKKNLIN